MQRDPALVSLSHDHHQALFVAQMLRRADGAGADAARAAFGEYWSNHGARHFEVEEQVLLPAFAEVADPHQPIVGQVLCDHVELRCRGRGPSEARSSTQRRSANSVAAWRSTCGSRSASSSR